MTDPPHRADAPPPVAAESSASHPAAPAAAPPLNSRDDAWHYVKELTAQAERMPLLDNDRNRHMHLIDVLKPLAVPSALDEPIEPDWLYRVAAAAMAWALTLDHERGQL